MVKTKILRTEKIKRGTYKKQIDNGNNKSNDKQWTSIDCWCRTDQYNLHNLALFLLQDTWHYLLLGRVRIGLSIVFGHAINSVTKPTHGLHCCVHSTLWYICIQYREIYTPETTDEKVLRRYWCLSIRLSTCLHTYSEVPNCLSACLCINMFEPKLRNINTR